MRLLIALRLGGAGGPSNLAVDEGFDGLYGGVHEGLGGTSEGGDDPAPVLDAPAATRNGACESVGDRACRIMKGTYSFEETL